MKTYKMGHIIALFVLCFFAIQTQSTAGTEPEIGKVGIESVMTSPVLIVEDHHNNNGRHRKYRYSDSGFEIFTSSSFRYNFSFKIGGGSFYQVVNVASDRVWPWNFKHSNPDWAFGVGIGTKGRFFGIPTRMEVTANHVNETKFLDFRVNAFGQVRLLVDIPIWGAGISIGPSYSVHFSEIKSPDTEEFIGSAFLPEQAKNESTDDIGIFHWLGFSVGFVF